MRWEPNAEAQDFKIEPEKVSILRENKVSLEEARKRLLDKTMNVVLWRPEDIPWLGPKREEYLEPFKTEVWQSYKSALDFASIFTKDNSWDYVSKKLYSA